MSRVLTGIATALAVGITGYFIYTVIFPKLKEIPPPVLPPIIRPAPYQPPPQIIFQPQPQPTQAEEYDDSGEPAPAPTRRTGGEGGGGGGEKVGFTPTPAAVQATSGTGTKAVEGGIQLVYKTTGKKAALPSKASPHRNGDRYSVNHKFINYIIIAYLKGNQEAVGCKTDGPNHGSCQSKKPECFWIDPDLQMDDGSIIYGAEYPHPKSNSVPCPSCKKAGISLSGKWFGYQGIAYQGSGGPSDRWNEVWVDIGAGPNGEPGNKWVNLLKENYTKNIPADWRRPNGLPVNFSGGAGTGLEAEIRMRGGSGTSIKYGAVYEIVNPIGGGGGVVAAAATTQIDSLLINYPQLFNSFYNRRRL